MIVDLHNHILFNIDDGPQNETDSVRLIQQMYKQGVRKVVTTPHFDPRKQDLEEFILKRRAVHEELKHTISECDLDFQLKIGAEIYFREEINYIDLSSLTLGSSDYLLIELPTRTIPPGIERTFENLILQGYNPILAHIERYSILREDLDLFTRLVDMGVVMQVNLSAYLEQDSFLKTAFKKNYIHILASDAHDANRRPAKWNEVDLASFKSSKLNQNALKIWDNELIVQERKSKIRRIGSFYW